MIERDPYAPYVPEGAYVPQMGDRVRFSMGERGEEICEKCNKALFFCSPMLQGMSGNIYKVVDSSKEHTKACTNCGEMLRGQERFAAFKYGLLSEIPFIWNGRTYYGFPACANELTLIEAAS